MADKAYRIGFVDLECTNLNADFGYILCGVVKDYHNDEPKILRVDDYPTGERACECGLVHWNDLRLATAIRDELESYDMVITYNGLNFDFPFLNTRLLYGRERGLDLSLFGRDRHKDLLILTRKALRLHNNKLDSVAKFFEFPSQKTPLDPKMWVAAAAGCTKSLNDIVTHCIADVLVLEETFDTLKAALNIR